LKKWYEGKSVLKFEIHVLEKKWYEEKSVLKFEIHVLDKVALISRSNHVDLQHLFIALSLNSFSVFVFVPKTSIFQKLKTSNANWNFGKNFHFKFRFFFAKNFHVHSSKTITPTAHFHFLYKMEKKNFQEVEVMGTLIICSGLRAGELQG
jgi:hypothetical protein